MNWKEEATDRLRQYDSLRQACSNIPQQLEQLHNRIYRSKSANLQPGGSKGGYSRGDGALLNDLVLQQELRGNLERSRSWVRMTEEALKILTGEERLILRRLYIYPESGSLERLCQELGVEKSSVYRRRDRALEKFTLALYGAPETRQMS